MSTKTLNLSPALYQYLLNVSLREPQTLKKLRETTHQLPSYAMQISPEQGQFMAMLVRLLGAKKTLEVGTYTGYSALVVALALPEDAQVITCDIDEKATNIARTFWRDAGVEEKIKLFLAPAQETLQKLIEAGEGGTFDFIFIDADKNNYNTYYEKALELIRKGGVIAIDNVLWNGAVADPSINDNQTKSIRALNEKLRDDPRIVLSMIPLGDGLTLAMKV